ncbi:hypothetical protein NH26_01915 [Flammeovirga pacifica]|uniref:Uncharacterized protein n=2 Tax=Flammeovirga pacifica TaxID=915059 RepID=A0A1S1YW02_FLAPC|nr:hypothetical protein NH26_01915 [Flammeovirga pacifica]
MLFCREYLFAQIILVFISCDIYAQGILDMKIEKSPHQHLILNLDSNETYESIFITLITDDVGLVEVNKFVQDFDSDSPYIFVYLNGKTSKVFLESSTIIPLELQENSTIVKIRGYYYNSSIGYSKIFERKI